MRLSFRQVAFLVILVFLGKAGLAQRIRFTDTGNKWSMAYFDLGVITPMYTSYSNDWVIAGHNYHQLVTRCFWTFPDMSLAVREDTTLGKIYFRFNAPTFWNANATDTMEHIFFDYNLKPGDTLKTDYSGLSFWYIVTTLDSVTLGSDPYKHWVMTNVSGDGVSTYDFIEGVGTNFSPVFSACPYVGFQAQQLRCFTTNGIRPRCQPPVGLPFSGIPPPGPTDLYPASKFDNDTSCVFRYPRQAAVLGLTQDKGVLMPNPGNSSSELITPQGFNESRLLITDATGRNLVHMNLTQGARITLGQYLHTPGVYHYVLQDAVTAQRFTGRFLFQ